MRKDARVVLGTASRLVMTLADGTRGEFKVFGGGRVSGTPCINDPCRAEGVLLGKLSDGAIGGVGVSDATYSFSFVGLLFQGGRLVLPASGSTVAVLLKLDGEKRRLSPQPDAPMSGTINLAARSFTLGGDLVDDEGTRIHFDLDGELVGLPPVASAGPDQNLECSRSAGTAVVLDGSASHDADGPLLSYGWKATAGALGDRFLGTTPRIELTLPLGRHEFELTVEDAALHVATDSVIVNVVDSTPPTITGLTLTPACLWPPNHSFSAYRLGDQALVEVSDECDPHPVIKFTNVASSELPLETGSGQTAVDSTLTNDLVCLRAERSGAGVGRTYSVTITATDQSGNSSSRVGTVVVPHDARVPCSRAIKGACP